MRQVKEKYGTTHLLFFFYIEHGYCKQILRAYILL